MAIYLLHLHPSRVVKEFFIACGFMVGGSKNESEQNFGKDFLNIELQRGFKMYFLLFWAL